jgi:hypothetical protein
MTTFRDIGNVSELPVDSQKISHTLAWFSGVFALIAIFLFIYRLFKVTSCQKVDRYLYFLILLSFIILKIVSAYYLNKFNQAVKEKNGETLARITTSIWLNGLWSLFIVIVIILDFVFPKQAKPQCEPGPKTLTTGTETECVQLTSPSNFRETINTVTYDDDTVPGPEYVSTTREVDDLRTPGVDYRESTTVRRDNGNTILPSRNEIRSTSRTNNDVYTSSRNPYIQNALNTSDNQFINQRPLYQQFQSNAMRNNTMQTSARRGNLPGGTTIVRDERVIYPTQSFTNRPLSSLAQ